MGRRKTWCCDCGVELTDENRSGHQPNIRCSECFQSFSGRVEDVLTGKATTTKEVDDDPNRI